MPKCVYCGNQYEFPRGLTYIKKDGSINHLCSSKCQKNMLMKRRKVRWVLKSKKDKTLMADTTQGVPSGQGKDVKEVAKEMKSENSQGDDFAKAKPKVVEKKEVKIEAKKPVEKVKVDKKESTKK